MVKRDLWSGRDIVSLKTLQYSCSLTDFGNINSNKKTLQWAVPLDKD